LLGTEEIGDNLRVAILVHGLEGGELTYVDWVPALEEHGWHCLKMIYPNDGDVKKPADFLRAQLITLQAKHPRTKFVILAHSLGGLVSWSALANSRPDELSNVTDLITLGTPYLGSQLASLQLELELADVAVRLWKRDWTGLDTISDGQGQAVAVLTPKSPQRRAILGRKLPPLINLHIAAGNDGPIPQSDRGGLAKLAESLVDRMKSSDELRAKLHTVATADEIYQGLGDGAVTLESATWPQKQYPQTVKSLRIFPRSHTGLLRVGNSQDELLNWVLERIRRDGIQ
jgi:pimeloyl-ACP methyl ester carboxylesterase